jgi:predicted DNA-binding transcriptional regulator AlpA
MAKKSVFGHNGGPPIDDFEDRRVLTLVEFRKRNRISRTTFYRLIDEMPPRIRLSAKREGITIGDERRWQQARRSA